MTRARVMPDALEVVVPGMDAKTAHTLARKAVLQARRISPKSSGLGARHLQAHWGDGFFGISWSEPYMWYQEMGIKAFTMHALAGKVIPMWVNDHDGSEAAKIPASKRATRTRIDAAGKRQVKIFRKVALHGARKQAMRSGVMRSVPASYPGAPGRIASRQTGVGGQSTGRIASRVVGMPHVGVRWRFPGLIGRGFMHQSLRLVAVKAGITNPSVVALRRA